MAKRRHEQPGLEVDPLWYKDAIIYELHVRAFRDSNGDGVGDFKGLKSKLDYLQDLGITAIWLLPFCPSPLKDDGYDIADYTAVHSDYGTLRDFKRFLREAHRRNIRVITELVLNHTSDQHDWFQRARRAQPGSRWRDFYVWSDNPDRYKETRIIFKDFESSNWAWDPVANAYYWHRFYSHQPDLNYDNPHVRKAVFRAMDFWLGMGVDGLRLDAVPYLYEREGTNCENLPETYEFLKELRRHVDNKYENKVLLAEANQWPEDAIAYLGNGDLCHMAYHFPLMPRLFMALRMEDRFPIIDIMDQTPAIPENCQWALFLRNHDELTLEMVTDEERDYMYRVYAQDPQMRINLGIRRRLAPLLGNHRRRIELMKGLLFSLPGSPIIYYGDEIGMGDNIYLGDRNGVRTPMHWSADRNAGFSEANSQQLYLPLIMDSEYHHEAINVENEQSNTHSLLWWTKRLIALRKRFKAFGRGTLEFLYPDNRKVLAFIRRDADDIILVVANLSRFVQYVELDLFQFKGMVPIEIFGGTEFPLIREGPYFITLGPHSFYWFGLVPLETIQDSLQIMPSVREPAILSVSGSSWESLYRGKALRELENILPNFLRMKRWFGGKARRIKRVSIQEVIPMTAIHKAAALLLVEVHYMEGDPEVYSLPLIYSSLPHGDAVLGEQLNAVVAFVQLRGKGEEGILYDAMVEKEFCKGLLQMIGQRRRLKGAKGDLFSAPTKAFKAVAGMNGFSLEPSLLRKEQSNTSVTYGEQIILKLFRRLAFGINPDLEIGRYLTNKGFAHTPPVAGGVEYRRGKNEPMTLAILQGFVQNQGDAWAYTLDLLDRYFDHIMTQQVQSSSFSFPQGHLLDLMDEDLPAQLREIIANYVDTASLLGQRTAELHVALGSAADHPDFAPEPFSKLYQRALYQSMRSLTGQVFQLLRRNLDAIPETLKSPAEGLLARERQIIEYFRSLLKEKITAMRIRCHGDYHLGQVLFTGKDFVIMDFEGEPARPIGERRIKRSPLRDVAGMLRSFHYAAFVTLFSLADRGLVRAEDLPQMEFWADFWHQWVCVIFLKSYLETAQQGNYLPRTRDELQVLLDALLLEKAIYELGYELNNRPEWVKIPLQGIQRLLGAEEQKI